MSRPRFTPRGVVGRGGGGEVWRVFDGQRGEEVALKRLRAVSPAHELAMRREHRVIHGLRHPNLVVPFELGRDDGGLYLLSPWVDARDICSYCDVTPGGLAIALPQLLSALHFLHERGLCHGDLSPANVRLDVTGRLRLIDFGLARYEGERFGPVGGTRGYMAPELLAGEAPNVASDLYALGRLLEQLWPPPRPPKVEAEVLALLGPAHARPSASKLSAMLCAPTASVADPNLDLPRPASPIVGREALRVQALAALRAGRSVILEGPSAVGKTALLRDIAFELERDGLRLLRSGGRVGAVLPFETVDGLLSDASAPGDLEPLVPAIFRLGRHSTALASWIGQSSHALRSRSELHRRLFGAAPEPSAARDLAAVLTAIGEPLLVIDDLQWMDDDSRACLVELLERQQVQMFGAAHPGRAAPFSAIRIEVPPLSLRLLDVLLKERGLTGDEARRVAAQADGLPGVALLAARFARDAKPLSEAMRRLVRELSEEERSGLANVWCYGALPVEDVGPSVAERLQRDGLVVAVRERLELAHDALRKPLEEALGADRVRAARIRLGRREVLSPVVRVREWLAAGDRERALRLAREAATHAESSGAWPTAASLWALVAEHEPPAQSELARALERAGRHAEAARLWAAVAARAHGVERREYDLCRVRALFSACRVAEGRALLEATLGKPPSAPRALAEFLRGPRRRPGSMNPSLAALALRTSALAAYFHFPTGVWLALEARAAFARADAHELGAWSDHLLAFFARFAGLERLAHRYDRAAAAWSDVGAHPIVAAFPGFSLGYQALREGRGEEAARRLGESLRNVEATAEAFSFEVQLATSLRTSAVLQCQRVHEAEAALAHFDAMTLGRGDATLEVHVETARSVCATWTGRFEVAVAGLDRLERRWEGRGAPLQRILLAAYRAWPRALLGQAPDAFDELEGLLRGQQALWFSAYGPVVYALVAATELAAYRSGHPRADWRRAGTRALAAASRPSLWRGLARRVVAYASGRGWRHVEGRAAAEGRLVDLKLAQHARAGHGVGPRPPSPFEVPGMSPRLFAEVELLSR